MSLPHADEAIVDPAKVRDYLLSSAHPVGRFKAVFFVSLGYSQERWEALRDDILALAKTEIARPTERGPHGQKFEFDATLTGPSQRPGSVRTVWIVRPDEKLPRVHYCVSEVRYV